MQLDARRLDAEHDICHAFGVVFQRDRSRSVPYGKDYFDKYVRYEGTAIADAINAYRTERTEAYCRSLLDVGIGSGEFIKRSRLWVLGYDINPAGAAWLRDRGLYADPYRAFPDVDGVTLWDCFEHLPEPAEFLALVPAGAYLFLSLPVFDDLGRFRQSKHFRPDEHYWYWTAWGLKKFLGCQGFALVEEGDGEVRAGRESIGTFVFRRAVTDRT